MTPEPAATIAGAGGAPPFDQDQGALPISGLFVRRARPVARLLGTYEARQDDPWAAAPYARIAP